MLNHDQNSIQVLIKAVKKVKKSKISQLVYSADWLSADWLRGCLILVVMWDGFCIRPNKVFRVSFTDWPVCGMRYAVSGMRGTTEIGSKIKHLWPSASLISIVFFSIFQYDYVGNIVLTEKFETEWGRHPSQHRGEQPAARHGGVWGAKPPILSNH